MADDLSSTNEFRDLVDRVRILETATPLQNAAVSEGRLRFIDGLLRVDSGGRVEIVGTLQIDGTTIATGSFEMTGDVDITGPLTVQGSWDFTGDGSIAGDVELTGTVTIPGAQPIQLKSVGGVAMITAGGGHLRGASDGINMQAPGGGSVFAAAGAINGAGLTAGSHQVGVFTDGIVLSGLVTFPADQVDQLIGIKDGVLVKVNAA